MGAAINVPSPAAASHADLSSELIVAPSLPDCGRACYTTLDPMERGEETLPIRVGMTVEEATRLLFLATLACSPNMTEAAKTMGVSAKTAYNWAHKWGVSLREDLAGSRHV